MPVNHFRIILFIVLIIPLTAVSNEEPPFEVCKEKLLGYLKKMEAINTPKEGEIYHVIYRMNTQYSKELGINSSETITEVVTGKNKLMLNDKSMQVFGDDKNVFVVIPEQKKIYWNDSDPRIFDDSNTFKKFLDIQKNLLNSAINIQCVERDGKTFITVIPNDKFKKTTKLLQQNIIFDNKLERITEVNIIYNKFSKIKTQSVVYEILDFKSSKKIIPPITALFKGNELRTTYKGFEIIDNRQNR